MKELVEEAGDRAGRARCCCLAACFVARTMGFSCANTPRVPRRLESRGDRLDDLPLVAMAVCCLWNLHNYDDACKVVTAASCGAFVGSACLLMHLQLPPP